MAFHRRKPAAIGVKAPFAGFVEPALATSIEKVPSGERWIHEIKFDGYRVQLRIANENVRVFTRRGNDWTKRFRKIANDAFLISASSAIVDGEVVVPATDGTTDFSVLQNELKGKSDKIAMVAFDLLYLNGYDVRKLPLIERKALPGRPSSSAKLSRSMVPRCSSRPAESASRASCPRSGTAATVQAVGYGLSWTMLFTDPLMTAVQIVSARMGRTTGCGIAGNLRQHCPSWLLTAIVTLLLIANAINIGADLGAMADASRLVLGGPQVLYVLLFAAICIALQMFLQYTRYVSVLKWLTLFLFAYVACLFMVKVPWGEALGSLVLAGSAAYAVGEARKWPTGLARQPMEAKAFYAIICIATIVGMIMNFTPIDPIRALYWSAVINGVVAVPVMAIMMWLAAAPKVMGDFVITGWTKGLGWVATAVMAVAVAAMLATS
jgi:hypothetical protein